MPCWPWISQPGGPPSCGRQRTSPVRLCQREQRYSFSHVMTQGRKWLLQVGHMKSEPQKWIHRKSIQFLDICLTDYFCVGLFSDSKERPYDKKDSVSHQDCSDDSCGWVYKSNGVLKYESNKVSDTSHEAACLRWNEPLFQVTKSNLFLQSFTTRCHWAAWWAQTR